MPSDPAIDTAPAFADLPYLDDYLREILRPRVEKALQSIERTLPDMIMRQVFRLVAAEQPTASEAMQATVRSLVEHRLGLKVRVALEREFSEAPAATAFEARREVDSATPEVTFRRPPASAMPLVSAVLNGGRVK
jgi:hypothetical protein